MEIQSPQNPRIKSLIALREKKKLREEEGLIVIEGARESERAIACGFELFEVYHYPENGALSTRLTDALRGGQVNCFKVSKAVYEKIAVRESTGNVVCVCRVKEMRLADLKITDQSVFLFFEDLEKPGNLGAVLRSADGAGVGAIFVVGESVDPYNANAIRASMGAVFSVPTFHLNFDEMVEFLKSKKIPTYLATPENAVSYSDEKFHGPCAVGFGNEAKGLSQKWFTQGFKRIKIPMAGIADSLNVSVAAGIVMYEIRRQIPL